LCSTRKKSECYTDC